MATEANGAINTTDLQKQNFSDLDKQEARFLCPGRGTK